MARDFLTTEHPVYTANKTHWMKMEVRLRGGREVLSELVRYQWETEEGEHFKGRQNQATYINFGELFMRIMVGHMFKEAPAADEGLTFGSLGEVKRAEGQTEPSMAELVYYNVDGTGQDGSQWNNFWSREAVRAGATGHRWIFCEAPPRAPELGPPSVAEVQAGQRPYLSGMSPLLITNWEMENGRLEMAIMRFWRRKLRITADGKLEGNTPEKWYLLMTRRGYTGLGADYEAGGWWMYNTKFDEDARGNWDKTLGEIPLAPLFYERDEGSELIPTMSRSGIEALSQIGVSYMNLSSAADFDAIDAAESLIFMLGVSEESFNLADTKMKAGSKNIPLPPGPEGEIPQIVDGSTGAVTATVFDTRLNRKLEEARLLGAFEASSDPGASGVSKEMGFMDSRSPRLALMASEMEQCQNTMLRFLEMRFGQTALAAAVKWPREFNLKPVVDDIDDHFALESLTGLHSPSLDAKLMLSAAKERGFIEDDKEATAVEAEYKTSVEDKQAAQNAQATALGG